MQNHTNRNEPRSWLWPDRIIRKRESRRLREEHNAAVNQFDKVFSALKDLTSQVVAYANNDDRDLPDCGDAERIIQEVEGGTQ